MSLPTTRRASYLERIRERTDAAAKGVPTKVPEGCQVSPDTLVSAVTAEELRSDLVTARAARKAQRHPIPCGDRAALRAPRRPTRREYLVMRKAYDRCLGYLVSLGLRALNDRRAAGLPAPSRDVLVEALRAEVLDRLDWFMIWDAREPGSAKPDKFDDWAGVADAEALVQVAADALVKRWRAEWVDERRVEGRSGGAASRRGPTKATDAAAWSLLDIRRAAERRGERLTQRRACAILGLEEATYHRVRRRLDAMISAGLPEPEGLF